MSILESYNKTKQFNTLCGSLAKADVVLQLRLMLEELAETAIAVKHKIEWHCKFDELQVVPSMSIYTDWDLVELIDGACDMKVISDGLLQILEAKGFDVSKALLKVGDNNLSKFPTTEPNMADYNPRWTKTYNEKFGVWVLKDENGKVRKPHDYVPVDLSDCIPKQQ
jgi:hypothetical protein